METTVQVYAATPATGRIRRHGALPPDLAVITFYRVTLSDNRLIVTRHGQKSERRIDSHRDYLDCLQQQFGIVLADDYDSQRWFERLTTAVS